MGCGAVAQLQDRADLVLRAIHKDIVSYPDAAHDPSAWVFVVVVVVRVVVLCRSRICAATLRRASDRLPLQAFFRAAGRSTHDWTDETLG